jgi:transposase
MYPPDQLANLPAALRDYLRALEGRAVIDQQQIDALQQRVSFLEDQFRLAQLKRFAPSSEKFGAQGCLFNEAEQDAAMLPETGGTDEENAPATAPRKRGHRALPAHLPRKRIEHDLPEAQKVCACCQGALHRMGEETSEQLDIIPAKVQVLQHVRFKYACRQCDRHGASSKIVTSPMPAQPIPGSNASAGTVATVLTAKYADGMPLYRQHDWLLRGEVDIACGTLAQWCIKAGMLLTPLYAALRQVLLNDPFIHGDETRVQVLNEAGRKAQSTSYM